MITQLFELSLRVEVDYNFTPGRAAYTEGPPERWEPGEAPTVELCAVRLVDAKVGTTIDVLHMLNAQQVRDLEDQINFSED